MGEEGANPPLRHGGQARRLRGEVRLSRPQPRGSNPPLFSLLLDNSPAE